MQYSLLIDQARSIDWGLNISEATLFCVVFNAPHWAVETIRGNQVWYWIANAKLAAELPLLTSKPDTIKRLMASLQKKGLINRTTDGRRTYIQITAKGKLWNSKSSREINPDLGGKNIPTKAGNISPRLDNQGLGNQDTKAIVELKPDPAEMVIKYLNKKAGKNYRLVNAHKKLINARIKEGATGADFKSVIDRKCAEWLDDPANNQYLRPATLFNAEKFNNYLGQLDSPLPAKRSSGSAGAPDIDFESRGWMS